VINVTGAYGWPTSCDDCRKPQPPGALRACSELYRDCFTFYNQYDSSDSAYKEPKRQVKNCISLQKQATMVNQTWRCETKSFVHFQVILNWITVGKFKNEKYVLGNITRIFKTESMTQKWFFFFPNTAKTGVYQSVPHIVTAWAN